MMEGNPVNAPEARAAWARRLLAIPDDAPEETLCACLLEKLDDEDFVPPAGLRQAACVLAGSPRCNPPPDRDAFLEAEQSRLRDEVAAFVDGIFQVPPVERRQRWEELTVQCEADAPLRLRLRNLEIALDAEVPNLAGGSMRVAALVEHLCRTVVLPPPARDAAHWELLWRIYRPLVQEHIEGYLEEDRLTWPEAARQLRRDYPEIASWAPTFLDTVGEEPWDYYRVEEWREEAERLRQRTKPPVVIQNERSPFVFIWLVVMVLIAFSRAARFGETPQKPPLLPPKSFQHDRTPPIRFEREEMERILQDLNSRDPDRKAGEATRRLLGLPPAKDSAERPKEESRPSAGNPTLPRRPDVEQPQHPGGRNAALRHAIEVYEDLKAKREAGKQGKEPSK